MSDNKNETVPHAPPLCVTLTTLPLSLLPDNFVVSVAQKQEFEAMDAWLASLPEVEEGDD